MATTYHCPGCDVTLGAGEALAQRYRCPTCAARLVSGAGRRGERALGPVPQHVSRPDTLSAWPVSVVVPPEPADALRPRDPAGPRPPDLNTTGTVSDAQLVVVLPPNQNDQDLLAMEQWVGALQGADGPVALEIAGDDQQRRLLVRGTPAALPAAVHALGQVYRHADVRAVPTEADPATVWSRATGRAALTLTTRLPPYVSLRTFETLEGADPLNPLLGALAGLAPGEGALAQLVVHGPAPARWAERHLRTVADHKRRGYGDVFNGRERAESVAAGLMFVAVVVAMGVMALVAWMYWGDGPWRYVIGIPTLVALLAGTLWAVSRYRNPWAHTLDEEAVAKLRQQAFACELRVFAHAPTEAQAARLAQRLAGAYKLFDTTAGNALVAAPAPPEARPDVLAAPRAVSVLSVTEIAGLWHLPVGEALELVARALFQRLLPTPGAVDDPNGVHIGVSRKGTVSIPVHLSRAALERNLLVAGRSQYGKSTFKQTLARAWMAAGDRAVVVVDPHRDLVQELAAQVPRARLEDAVWLDFADSARAVGLNVLDVSGGLSPDEIAEDFITSGKVLWAENWGPRMQVPLSFGIRALAIANTRRDPLNQYTILTLPTLLQCDPEIRREFLLNEVGEGQHPDVVRYFLGEFADTSRYFIEQVISPVVSKARAFERSALIRRVFGAPCPSVNLAGLLRDRKIVLISLDAGTLGDDMAGFLGSVILNRLRREIMRQSQRERSERARVALVVDEFQKFAGFDFGALVGELQKHGANCVLGTQALANLEVRVGDHSKSILGRVLGGVSTLVCFQCSGEDSAYWTKYEFDPTVLQPQSLTFLPPYHAYVRTLAADRTPTPAFLVETAPPVRGERAIARAILERADAYTIAGDEADGQVRAALQAFEEAYLLRPAEVVPELGGPVRTLEGPDDGEARSRPPLTPPGLRPAATWDQALSTPVSLEEAARRLKASGGYGRQ